MLPGAAQRLREVGPGISSLAERVRQQPMSLVLLDEIEKAHAEVFDLLLGVLGEGRMTASLGRTVDFRMTLVIMTSNLGAGGSVPVGFGGEQAPADHRRAVREAFRPELVNRIDHVITFQPLKMEDVRRIAGLELRKVAERGGLSRRGLKLRHDDEVERVLAERGWDPKMGARPLKRVIEEQVVAPLAVRMAAEPDWREREVRIVVEGGEAWLSMSEAERADAVVL